MDRKEQALREEIIGACLRMNELGINQGTAGNISARWKGGILITSSGTPYEAMTPADIVYIDMHGDHEDGRRPSTEWRFHLEIHRCRRDVMAVVHTHSIYATAIAIKGWEIPALHYMIAAAGGPTIRCAPYATFGTRELSDNALRALEGRNACLLGNHGVIATGATIRAALSLAQEVEVLARLYVLTLQLGGPNLLSEAEIERVRKQFENYGPGAQVNAPARDS